MIYYCHIIWWLASNVTSSLVQVIDSDSRHMPRVHHSRLHVHVHTCTCIRVHARVVLSVCNHVSIFIGCFVLHCEIHVVV